MKSLTYTTRYDNTKGEQDLKKAEMLNKRITQQMVTNIRKTTEISIALFQAFGGVIDQTYALGIQAGLRTLELISTVSTALAASTFGTTALLQAGAQAVAIALMLKAIVDLEAGKTENQQQTMNMIRVAQLATWR